MTKDTALRLALEALEWANKEINNWMDDAYGLEPEEHLEIMQAITAIKAALEAKDEPVAWRTFDGEGGYDYHTYEYNEDYAVKWDANNPKHKGWVEPLYTTPPQRTWNELTDEEYKELHLQMGAVYFYQDYGRAIESKLKAKNAE
jgi:hypothetical protein